MYIQNASLKILPVYLQAVFAEFRIHIQNTSPDRDVMPSGIRVL
jgi:hypothetical protein